MSRLRNARIRLRPWIAMAAAYAFALQILLSGVLTSQLAAADNGSAGGQFFICHGSDGSPDDGLGGAGQPQGHQPPCLLCVLAGGSPAVLPAAHAAVIFVAKMVSQIVPGNNDRIFEYHSPTGQYQRGPPASVRIVG